MRYFIPRNQEIYSFIFCTSQASLSRRDKIKAENTTTALNITFVIVR